MVHCHIKCCKNQGILSNKNRDRIPVLEPIVPTNITDVVKLLSISMATPVVVTSVMMILGLLLTSFDNIITPNTITYNEECNLIIASTQARITDDHLKTTLWAEFDVEEMRYQRNMSGIPQGILVEQIPVPESRWRFNPHYDVDPYP